MGAPVRSTPLLRSRDGQSLSETMQKYVPSLEFHFTKRHDFEGIARLFRLPDLRLGLFGVNAPGALAVSEVGDFRQAFVRGGQIRTRLDGRDAEYQPGDSLITMPGQVRTYDFGQNFSQTMVTIDPLALNRKLTALLGKKPGRKLEFSLNSEFSRAHNHQLQGLVDLYMRYLGDTNPLPPFLHQQMEETIVVAFLSANEHNYSRFLQDDAACAAPRTVRLAEEYIEANWDRSISIEELAEVTNTSARSLFRSFQQTRRYSPRTFAKIVRLRHARAALESAEPETTLTAIAFRFGFLSPGRFSADFRKVFGEDPAAVFKNARLRKTRH